MLPLVVPVPVPVLLRSSDAGEGAGGLSGQARRGQDSYSWSSGDQGQVWPRGGSGRRFRDPLAPGPTM